MSLSNVSADVLLEQAETASEEYAESQRTYEQKKIQTESWESMRKKALVSAGSSVAAASIDVKTDPEWQGNYMELVDTQIAFGLKKRKYDLILEAIGCWRTEQSTIRALGR